MLGTRLKRDRNACGYGCCAWTGWNSMGRRRKTKNERPRDKKGWRREEW